MINANDKNLDKIKEHLRSCLDKEQRFDNTLGLNLYAFGYMHFSVANFINYLILSQEGTPKQISKVIPVTEPTGAIQWDNTLAISELMMNARSQNTTPSILDPKKKDEIIIMPTGSEKSLRELCARYLLTDMLRDSLSCLPLVYERLACSLYHESCEYLLKEILFFERGKPDLKETIKKSNKGHSLTYIFSLLEDKITQEIKEKSPKLCCLLEKYEKAEAQISCHYKMSWSAYLRFNDDVKEFSTKYLNIVRALSWLLYEEVFNLDISKEN